MSASLLQTFQALTPRERREAVEFARCAGFNRRPEVLRLAEHLALQTVPATRTPERQFAAAFPGQPYDNARLRHTQSYLLEVLRRYLAYVEWTAEPAETTRFLARALHRRGLEQQSGKVAQTRSDTLENDGRRDAGYHFQRYQLHKDQLEQGARRERSARLDLQPLPDELTTFYRAEMLRNACTALSHQTVAGHAYRFESLEAMLAAAPTDELLAAPVVAVYFHAYQALKMPAETAPFEHLKTALAEHAGRFGAEELRGLYLLAINVCIRRMNAGERNYVREAFDLYRAALERQCLAENGHLSGFTYKNIIRIAAALGEHAWTEQFLEQYRAALHPRERDNVHRYNLAYLRFQQQDYARAMPLLRQVELEDPLNNLDARRMLLRSYFELKEWEALESLLHSFATYLRRQKNLGYHRQTNEKLLFFTKKLIEIGPNDPEKRRALHTEIEQTPDVAERAWLLAVSDV